MCGIAGVRRFDRAVDHVGAAAAASAVMATRGPDDANEWHDDRMALAFRRLAIVGVHDGRQPLVDQTGRYVLAGNGEIYNHLELRAGLESRGHRLQTHSDLEVALHLYIEQGPASFDLLRGMYAFAIWDNATGELVCCRDPFGIKPLYYQSDAGAFRFASELPALAESMPSMPALRPEAVLRFLTFQYVPEPDTAVAGCRSFPPATTCVSTPTAARHSTGGGRPGLNRPTVRSTTTSTRFGPPSSTRCMSTAPPKWNRAHSCRVASTPASRQHWPTAPAPPPPSRSASPTASTSSPTPSGLPRRWVPSTTHCASPTRWPLTASTR